MDRVAREAAMRLRGAVPELAMTAVLAVIASVPFTEWAARLHGGGIGVRAVRDFDIWVDGGTALLGGDLAAAYSDPNAQVGPPVLVIDALVSRLLGSSLLAWWALCVLVLWSLLATVALLARPRGAPWGQRWAGVGAAALMVVLGYAAEHYTFGRWWYVPTLLLVLAGATAAHRDRGIWAGVAVGTAVWFEPSASVAVAVLALAPRITTVVRGLISAAVVAGLPYLPFVPVRGFALGQGNWGVKEGTWVSIGRLLVPDFADQITWSHRLAQGAVAVAVAAAVILLMRRCLPMPALAIAAVAVPGLARLVTESFWWRYHWIVPFAFLLAAAVRLAWLRSPTAIPVAVAAGAGALLASLSAPLASAVALGLLASTPAALWARVDGALRARMALDRERASAGGG